MLKYLATAALTFAILIPAVAEEDALNLANAVDQEYDKVFVAHDAARLTAFFTDDATVLSPSAPAITGSKAILAHWQNVMKSNWTSHTFQVVSAHSLSDNAILATAHWSADLTDGSGKVTPFHGDTAQVLVNTSSGWKIKLVSWNVLK
jgi:ketosteroid isomerase-like protein